MSDHGDGPLSRTASARARRDRADLSVHEVTAMFHVWMTRPIPEGRRTCRDLAARVRARAFKASLT